MLQSDPSAAAAASLGTTRGLADILYPISAGTPVISVTAINQGTALGDCYFLSALGELVLQHPDAITRMIAQNANGTETVSLFTSLNGNPVGYDQTAYKTIQITVNNSNFYNAGNGGGVNGQAGQAVVNNQQVIWPQVIENAFAQLYGGYGGIANGGCPFLAMENLTGEGACAYAPNQLSATTLAADWSAGDLITCDTDADNATYNLVGDHAYMFDGLTSSNGAMFVKLLNPWGFDEPDLIPVSALSNAIAEIDIGQFAAPVPIATKQAPALANVVASIATTDAQSVHPFAHVTLSATPGAVETCTVSLSTSAAGALSNFGDGIYKSSTGTYTVTGTAAVVTAALDGLTFTPAAHQMAPGKTGALTFALADTDANGRATASTTLTISALADPIVLTGTVAAILTTDAASRAPFANAAVACPDAGQLFTATVTESSTANGVLSDAKGGAIGLTSGTYAISGTLSSINAALDALVFTPKAHEVAPGKSVLTNLALTVTDTAGSVIKTATTVTATARANPLTVTGVPAVFTSTDKAASQPFAAVVVTQADAGIIETAKVTLSSKANGILTPLGGGTTNGTSGVFTVSGAASAVTASLARLAFAPTPHQAAPGTSETTGLTLTVTDTEGDAVTSTTAVTISAVTGVTAGLRFAHVAGPVPTISAGPHSHDFAVLTAAPFTVDAGGPSFRASASASFGLPSVHAPSQMLAALQGADERQGGFSIAAR